MATFVKIWDGRSVVLKAAVNTAREVDAQRQVEYKAAVVIQSWFRGSKIRAYIRYLNESALVIQKNYRAYRGRDAFRKQLKNFLKTMKDQHYHVMAVKIQSTWRGYYVRKYVFSYYSHKEYLIGLMRKNSLMRSTLRHLEESEAEERLKREEKLQEMQDYEEARRHHYMLSTQTKEGIFKAAERSARPSFEDHMRSIKFVSEEMKPKRNDMQSNKMVRHPMTSIESEDKNTGSLTLPPLTTKDKIQGPFKPRSDVWKKRLTPLNPTLRVATAYDSEEVTRMELKAEEWRNRVHDKKFFPFTKLQHQYQPLLHTKSRYVNSVYSTWQFREEQPDKNVSKKQFTTVVPPIPLFEQV